MDVGLTLDLRARLLDRIASDPEAVWTPNDFADLGSRAAVDKTLQRLVRSGEIRRIDRGLYDRPAGTVSQGGKPCPIVAPSSALSPVATKPASCWTA